jgi:parvulin-like peptidyl-prolyl isomerase
MESATPQDIDNTFGTDFAAAVFKAPTGQWSGPVPSGYGVHLVKVDQREAGALPSLAQIRPAVQREWEAEQRKKARDALLQQLLSKYDVRIDGPLGDALRQTGQATPARKAR